MELIDVLRVLARHRLALVVGLLVAIAAGLAVQYRVSLSPLALSERVSTTTTAQTRLLLDAPDKPSAVDLDPGVADTLGLRAGLLADLLATDAVREEIARDSGVPPSELAVLPPASASPSLPVPLAVAAVEAAQVTTEPYTLAVAADASIPIVSLRVVAPDAASAKRIAAATSTAYERLVATRLGKPSRLSVERLGRIRTETTVDRLPRAVGLAAVIAVFTMWAVGLVLLTGLRRAWRGASRPLPA